MSKESSKKINDGERSFQNITGTKPVRISGIVGCNLVKINGSCVFEPTEEVNGGVTVYKMIGDSDVWLEYGGGGQNRWMIKQTKDKRKAASYANVTVASVCLPESIADPSTWQVWDGSKWNDVAGVVTASNYAEKANVPNPSVFARPRIEANKPDERPSRRPGSITQACETIAAQHGLSLDAGTLERARRTDREMDILMDRLMPQGNHHVGGGGGGKKGASAARSSVAAPLQRDQIADDRQLSLKELMAKAAFERNTPKSTDSSAMLATNDNTLDNIEEQYEDDFDEKDDFAIAIEKSLQDILDEQEAEELAIKRSLEDMDIAIKRSLEDIKPDIEDLKPDNTASSVKLVLSTEEGILKTEADVAVKVNDAFSSGLPVEIPMSVLTCWTQDFSSKILGEGGFGRVYTGAIRYPCSFLKSIQLPGHGKMVAVKKIKFDALCALQSSSESTKAATENDMKKAFCTEVNVLSNFRSCPNIIKLIGYCAADKSIKEACLVYEIAPLGDLNEFIKARPHDLLWQYRLKIAIGVATGLNYLHKHDGSQAAFHRDVKSANIVLMDDFTAKITDCGLSKYKAGTGANVDIFSLMGNGTSVVGIPYGTPEYMCKDYLKKYRTMAFDALCDIYSYGIVLLELLFGRQQAKDGIYLEEHFDPDSGVRCVVDETVSKQWPLECQQEFEQLAKACTAPRSRRIGSTNAIISQLRDVNGRFVKYTSMEADLMKRYEEVISTLSFARGQEEISKQLSQSIDCPICYCPIRLIDTIPCSSGNKGHIICKECFNDMIDSQVNDLTVFSKNGREIVCKMCIGGLRSPFDDQTMARCSNPLIFSKYQQMKDAAIQRELLSKHQADLERKDAEKQDALLTLKSQLEQNAQRKRDAEVERYSSHIKSNILTDRCPSCNLAIYDFDGCFAVQHEAKYEQGGKVCIAGCLKFFCAWCHEVCNSSTACHAHVAQCPHNKHPGEFWGTIEEYNLKRAADQKRAIELYLDSHRVARDLRQDLLTRMKGDLGDLKIKF